MREVIGITLKDDGKIYYFNPSGYKVKKGTTVIVETERGLQFGKVELPLIELPLYKITKPLNKIIRISTKKDYLQNKKNITEAKKAIEFCKKIVAENKMNMKMIDAEFTFDRSQLLFHFMSENRIDFRELAKELAKVYKTRIELRQVGVRDKARQVGGIGQCGLCLCCSKVLTNLDNVSINMVKNQNLTLNPSKINGVCGRLLCCLKYEDDNYTEGRKCLPKVGELIETEQGKGKVISLDILSGKYKILTESGEIIEKEKIKNGCC